MHESHVLGGRRIVCPLSTASSRAVSTTYRTGLDSCRIDHAMYALWWGEEARHEPGVCGLWGPAGSREGGGKRRSCHGEQRDMGLQVEARNARRTRTARSTVHAQTKPVPRNIQFSLVIQGWHSAKRHTISAPRNPGTSSASVSFPKAKTGTWMVSRELYWKAKNPAIWDVY
ncbi:hypothetical protein LZ32DRAFT_646523 [Colletotrichum eremochloae]|nr:hypothetical protein LZ32DRAFT_646523 [Colletotrichum eremochloae]